MFIKLIHFSLSISILLSACSSMKTKSEADSELIEQLATGNYELASTCLDEYREKEIYQEKDRVLYYLNKGLILHYQKEYKKSNENLDRADFAMEELYTRSISKGVLSGILNDNVMDYSGEVYDNLYVSIFKALNYAAMKDFRGSAVEIRRLNDKLRVLDAKYSEWVDQWNDEDTTGIKIEKRATNFYEDALANYLSYLVLRADGERDNARISFEKALRAWELYPEIYDYAPPTQLQDEPTYPVTSLNILAFCGQPPRKIAVGGEITTFNNYIIVTNYSGDETRMGLLLPGLEEGWHFKFAFPELRIKSSLVREIKVLIDGNLYGSLDLLEDFGKVADYTFQTKKNLIYFKTIARAVAKGIASERAKDKLQEETDTKDNFILRNLINLGVDVIIDATENADLRSWTTLPRLCFIAEFEIDPGEYDITIQFFSHDNLLIESKEFQNYSIYPNLNLLEVSYLN